MIKRWIWAFLVIASTPFGASRVLADCAVIARLDNLHSIQSRLARDPDTALFATDIRQIRALSNGLSNSMAVNAVDGNAFTGQGADVVRFLQNTQAILQRVSLDDPQSIRLHFTREVRENLQQIATYLPSLRCSAEQIAVDTARANARSTGGSDRDAEDLAEVAETLNQVAQEVLRPRSLIILILVAGMTMIIVPKVRQYLLMRKRRTRRHNTTYATQYQYGSSSKDGMLIDINCYGTKLRHGQQTPPPVGTILTVSICDALVTGGVVWSNAHYSGVQFRKAIPLADVDAVILSEDDAKMKNGAP